MTWNKKRTGIILLLLCNIGCILGTLVALEWASRFAVTRYSIPPRFPLIFDNVEPRREEISVAFVGESSVFGFPKTAISPASLLSSIGKHGGASPPIQGYTIAQPGVRTLDLLAHVSTHLKSPPTHVVVYAGINDFFLDAQDDARLFRAASRAGIPFDWITNSALVSVSSWVAAKLIFNNSWLAKTPPPPSSSFAEQRDVSRMSLEGIVKVVLARGSQPLLMPFVPNEEWRDNYWLTRARSGEERSRLAVAQGEIQHAVQEASNESVITRTQQLVSELHDPFIWDDAARFAALAGRHELISRLLANNGNVIIQWSELLRDELASIASTNNLPLLDARSRMRTHSPSGLAGWATHTDSVHPSISGSFEIANTVYDELRRQGRCSGSSVSLDEVLPDFNDSVKEVDPRLWYPCHQASYGASSSFNRVDTVAILSNTTPPNAAAELKLAQCYVSGEDLESARSHLSLIAPNIDVERALGLLRECNKDAHCNLRDILATLR